MTPHDEFIAGLREEAKGANLGRQAQAAAMRPSNFDELPEKKQWDIDKALGILDWDGRWST